MTEEIRPICLYIETCLHKKEGTRNCDKCEHHLNYWTEVMIRDMEKNIDRLKQENERLRGTDGNIHPDSAYYKIKKLEIENEELKARIKHQCYKCRIGDTTEDKYRSALEEIREIAKFNLFYNPEDLLINGDIGQIQDLKMTEIYNKINEVLL